MWMRGLEGAVRVRCPECCEADWRTRIELDSGRPFICYMCLCRSEKPLPARGIKDGCSSRLMTVSRRVRGLFRRRDDQDGAVV
jgi:hypothetical protein